MKTIVLHDFEAEWLKETNGRIEKQVDNHTYFVYWQNNEFVAYRRLKSAKRNGLMETDREAMNPTKFKYEIR